MLFKAEERLKNTKRLESLLRNRRSLLVYRGLKSLEVEPDDLSEVLLPDLVTVRDPVMDPSLFEGLPS